MSTQEIFVPRLRGGFWTWSYQGDRCEIVFTGKGPHRQRRQAFEEIVGNSKLRLSWPRQVHSATVLDVDSSHAGLCGEGDALTTVERDLALSVATADCVPIVIEGRRRLTTVHAGWRGLAHNILQQALEDFGEEPSPLRAWIGPAIGPCCYEVDDDVARQVVSASDPSVRINGDPRPHLDLALAARNQLLRGGVQHVETLQICTRCSPEWLWSYRRARDGAGRNWVFAWRHKDDDDLELRRGI